MFRLLATLLGVGLVAWTASAAESGTGISIAPGWRLDGYAYGVGDRILGGCTLEPDFGRSVSLTVNRDGTVTYSTTTVGVIDGELIIRTHNSVTDRYGRETVATSRARFQDLNTLYRASGSARAAGSEAYVRSQVQTSSRYDSIERRTDPAAIGRTGQHHAVGK